MKKEAPLIEVKNVSKRFKTTAGYTEAVRNANFQIPSGSFTIIYGPSGSGKTTLLNMMIGLDAPTTGSVTYEGKDLYSMDKNDRAFFRAHTMGMVQQTSHWVKSLSVLDNVALPLHFLGLSPEIATTRAEESLRRIGVEAHSHKFPSVLSGGEQQRAAMARALVNSPAYIVADEPTGNLDSKNGDTIIKILRQLNKKFHRTIVLVTHNLEYLSLGDKLLLMEDGIVTETKDEDIKKVTGHLLTDMKNRIEEWAHYE
jgi:putative ABC transport system ATP-binding protein